MGGSRRQLVKGFSFGQSAVGLPNPPLDGAAKLNAGVEDSGAPVGVVERLGGGREELGRCAEYLFLSWLGFWISPALIILSTNAGACSWIIAAYSGPSIFTC